MASMSNLEAINEIVETIGEHPAAAGSSITGTGTSIYDRAKNFLDRENTFVQAWGWPENTLVAQAKTAVASTGAGSSAFYIVLPTTVLQAKSSGPDGHRSLVLRTDSVDGDDDPAATPKLFDANEGTFDFASAVTVFVDLVEQLDFEKCSPLLQQAIVDQAKVKFQRRYQNSAAAEAGLVQEAMVSDIRTPRNKPNMAQPPNIQPVFGQQPQSRED
tara:strand:- start:539 stop:1186 length:648 start_codon:yes stop_codon:yes gene_type:complete